MALATKCDRCGQYFDGIDDQNNAFAFMKYDHTKNTYHVKGSEECFDLCPKCIKSLEK